MTAGNDQSFARPGRGDGRWIAGVCGGLAERWQLPVGALRAAFVVATAAFGAGVLLYAALALTMPERGATSARIARSAEVGRTLLLAVRVVAALLVVLGLAAIAAGLALFGLGSVALLLACACVLVLIVRPGIRPAPLGAAAVALALPAAGVALGDTQIARQVGDQTVELRTPADVDAAGYRSGTGGLLVDLRRFDAPRGSTTTIRARADLRSLVVALPRERCFELVVDQTLDRRWPAQLLDQRRPAMLHLGAPIRMPTSRERQLVASGQPPSLVAFGRPILGSSVRYRRTDTEGGVSGAGAPIIHLVLTTGRSQAIVRDYPKTASPLADPWWPTPQTRPNTRFGIPRGVLASKTVPNDRLVPLYLRMLARREEFFLLNNFSVRSMEDQVMGRRLPVGVTPERFARLKAFFHQELLLRAAAREADSYNVRFAGPCAPLRERLSDRQAIKLVASDHAWSRLAARWNVITRRWPEARSSLKLYRGSIKPFSETLETLDAKLDKADAVQVAGP